MIHKSNFKPAWWLTNRHLQTILPRVYPVACDFSPFHHDFELSDGDFIEITWSKHPKLDEQDTSPIVIILHGLEGSFESFYAKRMMNTLFNQDWTSVLMHFRGCGIRPNRKLKSYHSGQTADLAEFVEHLSYKYPQRPIFAIGFSLGGNVLAKYLGEYENAKLEGAVVISAPLELGECAKSVNQGFSKIYQKYLVDKLKKSTMEKIASLHAQDEVPLNKTRLANIRSLIDFDQEFTAPVNGFESGHQYYELCSGRQFLSDIKTPTLIIHAKDDPFMNEDVIPSDNELSYCVRFELSEKGGHVGFLSGNNPFKPEFWLETRSVEYIKSLLKNHTTQSELLI